jgi:hypothetical protein
MEIHLFFSCSTANRKTIPNRKSFGFGRKLSELKNSFVKRENQLEIGSK